MILYDSVCSEHCHSDGNDHILGNIRFALDPDDGFDLFSCRNPFSPVILWKKIGQPATNCNKRFFNGFRLCNVSLLTYQKSQKIPLREVTKKRDLL